MRLQSTLAKRLLIAALAVTGTFAASTNSASARSYSSTPRAGETRSFSIRRQLHGRPSVRVQNRRVASAWFDSSRNRLFIRGLRTGRTRVIFTGHVRRYIVGTNGRRLLRAVPFRDVVYVTVRGRRVRNHSKTVRLTVRRGRTRTWAAHVLFSRRYSNVRGPDGM